MDTMMRASTLAAANSAIERAGQGLTAGGAIRAAFTESHKDVLILDRASPASVGGYLLARKLAEPAELPCRLDPAGAGNMNLTMRVTLGVRSVIVKQGRPWVEKYDHIAAPWERTLTEGLFYQTARAVPAVSSRMPTLVDLDEHNHVLVLEDLGSDGDYTSLYTGRAISDLDLGDLLAWLSALKALIPPASQQRAFSNTRMRALNHEHIFRLPLAEENGLDLDAVSEGLGAAADELKRDRIYCSRVSALGREYLADGCSLVHGDYFPGSWVRTRAGARIIDPEFCFRGAREFDYAVMLAHFALARTKQAVAERVMDAVRVEGLDEQLLFGFAGTEVMRRLIGVAQLPLPYGMDVKRRLLDLSRSLVLAPEKRLTCWT